MYCSIQDKGDRCERPRSPFGLDNAHSTFMHLINILQLFTNKFEATFLNDIVVYICTSIEHLKHFCTSFANTQRIDIFMFLSSLGILVLYPFVSLRIDFRFYVFNLIGYIFFYKRSFSHYVLFPM